jgi:hypothetical protein
LSVSQQFHALREVSVVKLISLWLVLLSAEFFVFHTDGRAWAAGKVQIPSTLECSPVSTNPKTKRFTTTFPFFFANGSFKGERRTGAHPGREVYSGSIDQNKVIKIAGQGAYENGSDNWRSTFSGSLKNGDATVLKGYVDTERSRGRRDCSITFLLPYDKLASLLMPSGAPVTPVQTAQAKPQAPGEPAKDSNALPEQQQEQTRKQPADMARDLAERQNAAQQALKKQHAGVAQDFAEEQKAQAAATENPSAAKNEKQNTPQAEQTKPIKNADVSGKSLVEDYIVAHGGCAALSRSWEIEFARPDKTPYGKPFLDWDQGDFLVVRKWVERCLDPFMAAPGRREFAMQSFDLRAKLYQQGQERAREEIKRQEELAAAREKREQELAQDEFRRVEELTTARKRQEEKVQSLTAQYESSRTRLQGDIRDFGNKARPFLDQTRNLQFANIDSVVELGRDAFALGEKAQASVSDVSTKAGNLSRFMEQIDQRYRLRDKDSEFEQLHTTFEQVQTQFSLVQTALQRVQQIQARRQPCSQRLSDAGVPKAIIETKIFSANGDQDSYLSLSETQSG